MATMAQNITRIENAKSAIKTAIENKGVSIPTTAKIDTYSTYVDQIETGGGGGDIDTDLQTLWNSISDYNDIYSPELISPQIWEKYKQCFLDKNKSITSRMTTRGDMLPAAIETLNSNTASVKPSVYMVASIYNHTSDYYDLSSFDFNNAIITNTVIGIGHNKSGTEDIQIDFRGNYLPTRRYNSTITIAKLNYSSTAEFLNFLLTDSILDIRNNNESASAIYIFTGLTKINGGDTITVKSSGTNLTQLFGNCGGIKTVNFHADSIRPKYINQFISRNVSPATTAGVETVNGIDFGDVVSPCYFANLNAPMFKNLNVKQGSLIGGNTNTELYLTGIWNGDASTFGANYENFINRLGANTSGYTKTIRLNATLKNSLSATQLALATNKGYTIA